MKKYLLLTLIGLLLVTLSACTAAESAHVTIDDMPSGDVNLYLNFDGGINWQGELADPPGAPNVGDAYFDTDDGCSYIYDGADWDLLAEAGAGGIASVTASLPLTSSGGANPDIALTYDANTLDLTVGNELTVKAGVFADASHAAQHAVSGADTVFPADPDADRVLMWDDVPGTLVWSAAGIGDMTMATYDADTDSLINTAAGGTEWDSSGSTGFSYITAGIWSAVSKGIGNTNVVVIDSADAADDEYARFTANGLESRSIAEVKSDLSLGTMAYETATNYVAKSLFDAHTVLYATADNTPLALTVTEQTLVGRLTGANIAAISIGIADNNILQVDDADAADNNYAKFTANGLEGVTGVTVLSDIGAAAASHAANHAVSGGDTIFPADPGADRYLMWDDDPGALVWSAVGGGGDMLKATYDTGDDSKIDTAAGGTNWDSSGQTGFTYITAGTWSVVAKGIANTNVVVIDSADVADDEYARFTASGLESRSIVEVKSDLGLGTMAYETATNYVTKALFDAHTILYATADNTPAALTVTEQSLVGRLTGGNIAAISIGISDDYIVQIDAADVADNDYAKFTANGLEGRSYAEVLSDIGAAAASHAANHAVSGGDTIFPADPGADRYLMWDDDPGALVWAAIVGGGDMLKTTYDADTDNKVDAAAGGTDWDSSGVTGFSYITAGIWSGVGKGIANGNVVVIDDADAADDNYARLTANGIEGVAIATVKSDLGLGTMAYETATNYVLKSLFDAHTVIYATADDTPAALTVNEQTLVGRLTGGNITAVSIGIADNNIVQIDGADIADDEYARFTANGLESRTAGEVLTNLLASTLAENDIIQLEELLSADGKYSGIACNGVYGANLVFGDLIYLNNDDGRWELADADAEATASYQLGIALESGADGDTKKVLLYGYIREDDWNWATVGAPLFVSATDGDFVATAPAGAGDIIRIGGYVKSADIIFFCPENDFFEHN